MFPCEMARYIAGFQAEARKYGRFSRLGGPKSPIWRGFRRSWAGTGTAGKHRPPGGDAFPPRPARPPPRPGQLPQVRFAVKPELVARDVLLHGDVVDRLFSGT